MHPFVVERLVAGENGLVQIGVAIIGRFVVTEPREAAIDGDRGAGRDRGGDDVDAPGGVDREPRRRRGRDGAGRIGIGVGSTGTVRLAGRAGLEVHGCLRGLHMQQRAHQGAE